MLNPETTFHDVPYIWGWSLSRFLWPPLVSYILSSRLSASEKCHRKHGQVCRTNAWGPWHFSRCTCLKGFLSELLFVEQEDMSSCSTRRHFFLLNKKTCLLVEPEDISSCRTGRHVYLLNKKTCLPVPREDMSS